MASEEQQLTRECCRFTSYMVGCAPSSYVIAKYLDANATIAACTPNNSFDRLLVRLASAHPLLTLPADSYARFFRPTCALRNKLVVLLSIVESSPMCHETLEFVDGGPAQLAWGILWRGLRFAVSFLAAVLLLAPVNAMMMLAEGVSAGSNSLSWKRARVAAGTTKQVRMRTGKLAVEEAEAEAVARAASAE